MNEMILADMPSRLTVDHERHKFRHVVGVASGDMVEESHGLNGVGIGNGEC